MYGGYAFRITWGCSGLRWGGDAVASASENCKVVSVTRDGPAASNRPATEIVGTQRSSGVCVCMCVWQFITVPPHDDRITTTFKFFGSVIQSGNIENLYLLCGKLLQIAQNTLMGTAY